MARMKKMPRMLLMLALFCAVLFFIFNPVHIQASACTGTTTGNWSDGTKWSGCSGAGGIPGAGDDVTINSGVVMTMDVASASLNTLTVTGTLNTKTGATSFQLTTGTLTISASATLTANASTITLNGTSGTLFTKNATGTFTFGTSTVVLSGNGDAIVNSGDISFNKLTSSGTGTKTLTGSPTINNNLLVSAGTFDLATSDTAVGGTTAVTGTLNDSSTTGGCTFLSRVLINSGGSWTSTGNESYEFDGGLTVAVGGSFTSGTGTYTFGGSSIGAGAAFSIGTVSISTSLTNANTSGFTVATALTGNLTQGVHATLNIGGTYASGTLTATASTNTVKYTSTTANQTIKATTYANLTIDKSGFSGNLSGTTIVNNNLTITAGILSLNSRDITVTGTTTINGELDDFSAAGTNIFVGAVTINLGIWDASIGDPAFTFRGGLTNNFSSGFTSGAGVYTFDTNAQTISATQAFEIQNITNNVTSSTGLTIADSNLTADNLTQGTNAILTFSGSVPSIVSPIFTSSGNLVNYTGSTQAIISGIYNDLTVNGSGIATIGGSTTVAGTMTVSSPIINNSTLFVTTALSGTSTFTQGPSSSLEIGGTITVTTLDASVFGNSVQYDSSTANQTIKGATYYNLNLNNDGHTATLGGDTIVNGTLFQGFDTSTFQLHTYNFTFSGSNTQIEGTIDDDSATGTDLFTGLLWIDTTGAWTSTGNSNYEFQGSIEADGSFSSGSGTYTFDTNSQYIYGSGAPFTITNVVNDITASDGLEPIYPTMITHLTQGTNAVLLLYDAVPSITTLDATASGNLVNYIGGIDQAVIPTTYDTLYIQGSGFSGSASVTLGGNTVVNTYLYITAEATFNLSSYDFTNNGTTEFDHFSTLTDTSATGTNIFVGMVTIDHTGIWSETNNPSYEFRGGLTANTSAFTSGTGTYTFSTNAQTISGDQSITITNLTNTITTGNGLTFSGSNETVTNLTQGTNAVLTFSGTVPSITSLSATASGNTVNYTSTSTNQTVKAITYNNLTINDSGKTATLSGNTTVNGDLIISAGTLDASTSNYSLTILGNYANAGTFTARSGTVTFSGTGVQSLSGNMTGSSAFYNLTLTNASGTDASDSERTDFVPGIDMNAAVTSSHTFTITTASVRVEYQSGQTYTFANINWNGNSPASRIFFRNSATSGTWLLKVPGTQTAVSYVNVSRSDASGPGGNAIVANDTTNYDAGNNTNWIFTAGIAISGTANGNEGKTVKVAINNSLQDQTATISSGVWTISGVTTPSVNDIVTVWVDSPVTDATDDTTGVTKWSSGNISGMVLNNLVLTMGSSQNTSLTLTNLGQYDNVKNSHIMYTSSGGALVVDALSRYTNPTLSILSGTTLSVGDSESVITGKINVAGTLTSIGNATYALTGTSGTLFTLSGTFTPSTSTVTLSGNGSATVSGGAMTFQNLTSSGTGTKTLGGTTTTEGTLTVSAGTLDTDNAKNYSILTSELSIGSLGTLIARDSQITVTENWTNDGTFTAGSSEVILNGPATATVTGATNFYDLTITHTDVKEVDFSTTGSDIIAVSHYFEVDGHAGALIKLYSTSAGTKWHFKPEGGTSVNFANIKDGGCEVSSVDISTTSVVNSGNNDDCWGFFAYRPFVYKLTNANTVEIYDVGGGGTGHGSPESPYLAKTIQLSGDYATSQPTSIAVDKNNAKLYVTTDDPTAELYTIDISDQNIANWAISSTTDLWLAEGHTLNTSVSTRDATVDDTGTLIFAAATDVVGGVIFIDASGNREEYTNPVSSISDLTLSVLSQAGTYGGKVATTGYTYIYNYNMGELYVYPYFSNGSDLEIYSTSYNLSGYGNPTALLATPPSAVVCTGEGLTESCSVPKSYLLFAGSPETVYFFPINLSAPEEVTTTPENSVSIGVTIHDLVSAVVDDVNYAYIAGADGLYKISDFPDPTSSQVLSVGSGLSSVTYDPDSGYEFGISSETSSIYPSNE